MAPSLFPFLLPFSFLHFVSFKVSRQSEAACHRSFVYSDKIAAFIVCQINLKKRVRRVYWEREGGEKERGKGGLKKKNNNTHITASSSLALACFYLSMTNSSIHSFLSSFLHIFSSPYLLSQHCITCHFRIMSPMSIMTLPLCFRLPWDFQSSLPTHVDARKDTHLHTDTHTNMQMSKGICPLAPRPTELSVII